MKVKKKKRHAQGRDKQKNGIVIINIKYRVLFLRD